MPAIPLSRGKKRKIWVFNMRLSYSRLDYYEVIYDQRVGDINLIELLEICENIGFGGIGFYEKKNFLHLDVRPTKRSRWRE